MRYGGLGRLRCRLSPAFGFPWPRDQKSVPNKPADPFPMNSALKSKWLPIFAGAAGLCLLSVVFMRMFFSVAHRSPETIQLSNLKRLVVALRASAEEHDGRFPTQISELPLDRVPAVVRQFRDPVTGQLRDWLYYPGRTLNDPPEAILLASPTAVSRGRRLVACLDTVTTITSESEFQRLSVPPHQ